MKSKTKIVRRRRRKEPEISKAPTAGPTVPKDIARGAASFGLRFIGQREGISHGMNDPSSFIKAIEKLRIAGRKSHIEGLALAYAIYAGRTEDLQFLAPTADQLIREAAQKGGGRKSELRCIIEGVVSYGPENPGADDTRRARNLLSRDEKAVTHLIDRGIPPDQVLELHGKPGEGVVAWERAARNGSTDKPAASESPRKQKVAQDLVGTSVFVRGALEGEFWEATVQSIGGDWASLKWKYVHEPKDEKHFRRKLSSLYCAYRLSDREASLA